MFLFEFIKRIKFCKNANRIGPDIPFTHWRLHFKTTMLKLCKRKFNYFDDSAYFRAGAYAEFCSNISIGKNVVIRPNSMLFADENAKIIIEDNVLIGSGVHFYVDNHKFDRVDIPLIEQGYYPSEDIVVREGSWIGANSMILTGVIIGRNSVIGAGSIVTKSIPDFCVAAGNPAKVIKVLSND
ncbi:MAG: acetyltransferase [Arcobacter sp.]|nr:acetyltransferase [Arcobacter sp.]|tara:strand:+ start:12477 stop:13025 length:549 start_codon:yes stop_codon:yes gene_type:complete